MSFLQRVHAALTAAKVPFAIVGGYAVALHGAVRGTVDLDIVLRLRKKDFVVAEAALKTIGLSPRLPLKAEEVFEFREEYLRNRHLVAWGFVHSSDPTQAVDIILTHDLQELRIEPVKTRLGTFPVLAKADLIAMKKRSGRPQDLEDIRALGELA